MNYIDILILLPMLYSAWKGYSKGLIIEVATMVALLLGVFVAMRYSYLVENFLTSIVHTYSKYMRYISLGITFIVVVIVIQMVGRFLTKVAKMAALGFVNKACGAAFAVIKAFVVVCVLLLLADALDDKFHFIDRKVKEESMFYRPFLEFASDIYNSVHIGEITRNSQI